MHKAVKGLIKYILLLPEYEVRREAIFSVCLSVKREVPQSFVQSHFSASGQGTPHLELGYPPTPGSGVPPPTAPPPRTCKTKGSTPVSLSRRRTFLFRLLLEILLSNILSNELYNIKIHNIILVIKVSVRSSRWLVVHL